MTYGPIPYFFITSFTTNMQSGKDTVECVSSASYTIQTLVHHLVMPFTLPICRHMIRRENVLPTSPKSYVNPTPFIACDAAFTGCSLALNCSRIRLLAFHSYKGRGILPMRSTSLDQSYRFGGFLVGGVDPRSQGLLQFKSTFSV